MTDRKVQVQPGPRLMYLICDHQSPPPPPRPPKLVLMAAVMCGRAAKMGTTCANFNTPVHTTP